ncbi:MAG: sigma-70 family RNA polymerase sigma factor [Verrucomicrobiota bacterium]|jgi:RNA polymerase sigma-70 factor (ECF subfamily)
MHTTTTTEADRFLALLEPIERDLERYSRRLIWEPQEAPDALQNAVLRAFAAFDRYHEDASFRAWMFRILTNEVFALNRKHARIARHEFQLEPEELEGLVGTALDGEEGGAMPTPEALAERMEPELAAALRTLTDAERAVLLLRALGDLRYREIAVSLDMPLGSVMGHLARARLKTRLALARHQITPTSSKVSPS